MTRADFAVAVAVTKVRFEETVRTVVTAGTGAADATITEAVGEATEATATVGSSGSGCQLRPRFS